MKVRYTMVLEVDRVDRNDVCRVGDALIDGAGKNLSASGLSKGDGYYVPVSCDAVASERITILKDES